MFASFTICSSLSLGKRSSGFDSSVRSGRRETVNLVEMERMRSKGGFAFDDLDNPRTGVFRVIVFWFGSSGGECFSFLLVLGSSDSIVFLVVGRGSTESDDLEVGDLKTPMVRIQTRGWLRTKSRVPVH